MGVGDGGAGRDRAVRAGLVARDRVLGDGVGDLDALGVVLLQEAVAHEVGAVAPVGHGRPRAGDLHAVGEQVRAVGEVLGGRADAVGVVAVGPGLRDLHADLAGLVGVDEGLAGQDGVGVGPVALGGVLGDLVGDLVALAVVLGQAAPGHGVGAVAVVGHGRLGFRDLGLAGPQVHHGGELLRGRADLVLVVAVVPALGDVDLGQFGVGDGEGAVVVLGHLARVVLDGRLGDGVGDLVALVVELGQVLELPGPAVGGGRRGGGDPVAVGEQLDVDGRRAAAVGVVGVVPDLGAADLDALDRVGEGRRVLGDLDPGLGADGQPDLGAELGLAARRGDRDGVGQLAGDDVLGGDHVRHAELDALVVAAERAVVGVVEVAQGVGRLEAGDVAGAAVGHRHEVADRVAGREALLRDLVHDLGLDRQVAARRGGGGHAVCHRGLGVEPHVAHVGRQHAVVPLRPDAHHHGEDGVVVHDALVVARDLAHAVEERLVGILGGVGDRVEGDVARGGAGLVDGLGLQHGALGVEQLEAEVVGLVDGAGRQDLVGHDRGLALRRLGGVPGVGELRPRDRVGLERAALAVGDGLPALGRGLLDLVGAAHGQAADLGGLAADERHGAAAGDGRLLVGVGVVSDQPVLAVELLAVLALERDRELELGVGELAGRFDGLLDLERGDLFRVGEERAVVVVGHVGDHEAVAGVAHLDRDALGVGVVRDGAVAARDLHDRVLVRLADVVLRELDLVELDGRGAEPRVRGAVALGVGDGLRLVDVAVGLLLQLLAAGVLELERVGTGRELAALQPLVRLEPEAARGRVGVGDGGGAGLVRHDGAVGADGAGLGPARGDADLGDGVGGACGQVGQDDGLAGLALDGHLAVRGRQRVAVLEPLRVEGRRGRVREGDDRAVLGLQHEGAVLVDDLDRLPVGVGPAAAVGRGVPAGEERARLGVGVGAQLGGDAHEHPLGLHAPGGGAVAVEHDVELRAVVVVADHGGVVVGHGGGLRLGRAEAGVALGRRGDLGAPVSREGLGLDQRVVGVVVAQARGLQVVLDLVEALVGLGPLGVEGDGAVHDRDARVGPAALVGGAAAVGLRVPAGQREVRALRGVGAGHGDLGLGGGHAHALGCRVAAVCVEHDLAPGVVPHPGADHGGGPVVGLGEVRRGGRVGVGLELPLVHPLARVAVRGGRVGKGGLRARPAPLEGELVAERDALEGGAVVEHAVHAPGAAGVEARDVEGREFGAAGEHGEHVRDFAGVPARDVEGR